MESKRLLATLIALITAASGFLTVTANTPPDRLISRDAAIKIIEAHAEVDPTKQIVNEGNLVSAELQYMAIHWENYLRMAGYHRRIYVSTTPVGDVSPYWLVNYGKVVWHYFPSGGYIVDARTGELMLAYEDTGGPPMGSDYSFSLSPEVNSWTPLTLRPGETKTLIITLTSQPTYEASLPIHITARGVPDYLIVRQNTTSGILTTNGRVTVEVRVSASAAAFDAWVENLYVEIDVTLLGSIGGRRLDVVLRR